MFSRLQNWTLLVILLSLSQSVVAQDFRIYTRVYDAGTAENVRPNVIGSSLSLFHAGKVYDHVENENESEVIIFEPAHQRFTIFSTSRSLATTVHFDQIKRKLKLARNETEEYVQSLLAQQPPASPKTIEKLRFPIQPEFKTNWGKSGKSLSCSSRHLSYQVRTAEVDEPESVDLYLNYADWMARLNYVMHPHALCPEPRMAVNRELRAQKKMPVQVELTSSIGMPIHLRAEHQIHWKLDATDRGLIHEWESLLKSEATREVTFQEYQRAMLVSQGGR